MSCCFGIIGTPCPLKFGHQDTSSYKVLKKGATLPTWLIHPVFHPGIAYMANWALKAVTSVLDRYLVFHVVDKTSILSENHSMGQAILDLPMMETQPIFHTALQLADLVRTILNRFVVTLCIFSCLSIPYGKFCASLAF